MDASPASLSAFKALNIPSLDEIAADPSRALGLSREVIAALLNRCSGAQMALAVALASPAVVYSTPVETSASQTLDADSIARELGVKRRWVFRNAKKLPFVRRISRKSLVCEERDLKRWRAAQKA
jgi:hypothetical protein